MNGKYIDFHIILPLNSCIFYIEFADGVYSESCTKFYIGSQLANMEHQGYEILILGTYPTVNCTAFPPPDISP